MSDQETILQKINLQDMGESLPNRAEVKIQYDKDGADGRGYYIRLTMEYNYGSGRIWRIGCPKFRGARHLILTTKRFSQKTLDRLSADQDILSMARHIVETMLKHHRYNLAVNERIELPLPVAA